ncbi:MAG: NAD-dependent epimerase/dehydratase family protein [Spirochaetes bacterium]|nr:NAD-dependent epimerase/dehydratase family protein [Spirochaetota bacterium]
MKRKKRSVLVTGGGGFLGAAIARKLVARGDRVRSLSRGHYPELDDLGVEQFRGDIGDETAVFEACREMDAVIHTAALAGTWGPYEDFHRTNVAGTEHVIGACREHGIAAMVHTSTPGVVINGREIEGADESLPYPRSHHSHYSSTKAMAEMAVQNAVKGGLPAVILRPHVIWGPGDNHLVPRIISRAKRIVQIGDGENLVDTIYVDNAADAHILAMDRLLDDPSISGRIYFICQNEPVRLWSLVNMILQWAGFATVKKSISLPTARAAAFIMENSYRIFGLRGEPLLTRFVVDELGTSHWFDVSAARRDLGFVPAISMEEGLRRTEKWVRQVYGPGK